MKSKENWMLLIVDPQIDFIDGSLPVPGAVEAMDSLASHIKEHGLEYKLICITCDRHTLTHCSFNDFGGKWPIHCVESSVGAAIWPAIMEAILQHADKTHILYKGEDSDKDEYSIFQNPKGTAYLDSLIKNEGIAEIDICGLAGDVCVAATLCDAEKRYVDINFNLLDKFTAYINR